MLLFTSPFVKLAIALWLLSGTAILFDNLAGRRMRDRPRAIARWFYLEIKPFFLYAITFDLVATVFRRDLNSWDAIMFALHVVNYYSMRNLDDDDRWKRRKAKLKEMVSVAGGKLVVVPAASR